MQNIEAALEVDPVGDWGLCSTWRKLEAHPDREGWINWQRTTGRHCRGDLVFTGRQEI